MLVGGLFFHSVKLVGLDCHMALNDTQKKAVSKAWRNQLQNKIANFVQEDFKSQFSF